MKSHDQYIPFKCEYSYIGEQEINQGGDTYLCFHSDEMKDFLDGPFTEHTARNKSKMGQK